MADAKARVLAEEPVVSLFGNFPNLKLIRRGE
jgi:hypothetical protein